MTHTHDFHRIGEVSKFPKGSTAESLRASLPRPLPGVEVVCVGCGQVRRAYSDGVVEIAEQGGNVIDESEQFRDKDELRFNIPADAESKRRLLIDLEDKIGVPLREEGGQFVIAPYHARNA